MTVAVNQNQKISPYSDVHSGWSNRQTLFNLARKAHRRGDLSFALGVWSNERKDGTLQSWEPTQEMVSATIKFAIATNRWSEKKKEES